MLAFLENRLGLFSWLRELGGTARPPREASFLQGLGFATLCVLAVVEQLMCELMHQHRETLGVTEIVLDGD